MTENNDRKNTPVTITHHVHAVYSSLAMLAGMQLDVFTPLKDGPMNAETLADELGVRADKLSPLLYALAAADLLNVENGLFSNTEESGRYLVRGMPDYMGGLHGFYSKLWSATLNTAESIRTGKPKSKLDWTSLPEDQLFDFFRSQYPSSLRGGRQIAKKIDFSGFRRLLDAGGGTGGLSVGICETFPDIKATVADLQAVLSVTKQFISEAGMSERISITAADLAGAPPEGSYDVAVLRAVLQVMSPEHAEMVLKNIYQVMEPGGVIYILGAVLEDTRLSPPAAVAAAFAFVNIYDSGHSYTEKEHRTWLTQAGFSGISVEHNAMPDGMGIVSARKA